mgnify:CR=1 FL=1
MFSTIRIFNYFSFTLYNSRLIVEMDALKIVKDVLIPETFRSKISIENPITRMKLVN